MAVALTTEALLDGVPEIERKPEVELHHRHSPDNGLGGITTEIFRDVIYRPAPVSAAEASAMLESLKAAPLLKGFRGTAKADVAALSELISQVSVLAARHAEKISEIELNPVLVHAEGQGLTIVDALVVGK